MARSDFALQQSSVFGLLDIDYKAFNDHLRCGRLEAQSMNGRQMATHKQIAANRANAKRSTGPKTKKGKLRSSMNAWRHGLSAKAVVADGENLAEFEALHTSLV